MAFRLKKRFRMLFTFQTKRRSSDSWAMRYVRHLLREDFRLLPFHTLFLFVVISVLMMGGFDVRLGTSVVLGSEFKGNILIKYIIWRRFSDLVI